MDRGSQYDTKKFLTGSLLQPRCDLHTSKVQVLMYRLFTVDSTGTFVKN